MAINWRELIRAEPRLARLEAEIGRRETTVAGVITSGYLARLVGRDARHPRCRSSSAVGVVYRRLKQAEGHAGTGRHRPASGRRPMPKV